MYNYIEGRNLLINHELISNAWQFRCNILERKERKPRVLSLYRYIRLYRIPRKTCYWYLQEKGDMKKKNSIYPNTVTEKNK